MSEKKKIVPICAVCKEPWTLSHDVDKCLDALRAENARLREALERCGQQGCVNEYNEELRDNCTALYTNPIDWCACCIARAALEQEVKP